MRARMLLTALVLVLVAAACGGGNDDSASGASTTKPAGSDTASDDGGDGGGSSDVDCAAMKATAGQVTYPLQILAQLRTQDQYDLVKDGTLQLDPAVTLGAIAKLRALESVEVPDSAGSLKDALDLWEEAATLAQENLAVDDPFTEAKGDELVALTADVGAFLKGQVAVGFALDGAGCG